MIYFRLVALATLAILASLTSSEAQIPTDRIRIAQCWRAGAVTPEMMRLCSGLSVTPPVFYSCMNNGPCFGDNVRPSSDDFQRGERYCGGWKDGVVQPPCPGTAASRQCGHPDTIPCLRPLPGAPIQSVPIAYCGVAPWPPCRTALPCGQPGTFECPAIRPYPRILPYPGDSEVPFGQLSPNLQVILPDDSDAPQPSEPTDADRGIQLAKPPLPDEGQLQRCHNQTSSRRDFFECVINRTMPREYTINMQCMNNNRDDWGRALVCSTNDQRLNRNYDRFKKLNSCNEHARDRWDVAQCVGDATLSESDNYYLRCITENRGKFSSAAVCAIGRKLTPEQQIALACAITSGGQPYAFATCTGGQLLERELDKCLRHGVATNDGCFGPNNEYIKVLRSADQQLRKALGGGNEVYRAYQLWQNNVLAPGPNHDVIRHLNNGIRDIQDGPGKNNEYVKAARAINSAVRSIGKLKKPRF
jgi:hypothetical protein